MNLSTFNAFIGAPILVVLGAAALAGMVRSLRRLW